MTKKEKWFGYAGEAAELISSHNNNNNNNRIRLHLFRHGETESNFANLVLGQTDSPLTNLGIQQALETGRCCSLLSNNNNNNNNNNNHNDDDDDLWRIYSSDLYRAERTTQLILSTSSSSFTTSLSKDIIIRLDSRLRELAKGVREGRDKNISYSEAMILFHQEKNNNNTTIHNNNNNNNNDNLPRLETIDEGVTRFCDWIQNEILANVVVVPSSNTSTSSTDTTTTTIHVMAVSHSGMIRAIVETLVPHQIPSSAEKDLSHKDHTHRLKIPNLSQTILDIYYDYPKKTTSSPSNHPPPSEKWIPWTVNLVQLANTQHLKHIIT